MDRRSMLGIFATSFAASYAAPWAMAASGNWEDDFSRFMMDGLRKTGTAGVSVATVRNGRTQFVRGFGLADMQARTPVTPDTAFPVASVSKVVTGTAMMMLQEQGAFKLDDPIAPYLDFPVVNPAYPDTPITFRHLLSHTSGISDAVYNERNGDFGAGSGDQAQQLRDFLAAYLAPNGRWYAATGSYGDTKPGSTWSYTHVGVALLGYLAGRVNAEHLALDALTQKRLFSPLGMRNTGWNLSAMGKAPLAQSYARQDGALKPLPSIAHPDWPAELLRTSARDFARILEIFSGEGAVDGRRYLQQGTLAAFLSPQPVAVDQNVQQALIWTLRDQNHLAMHYGGDNGADSVAALDVGKRVGALMFSNVTGNDSFRAFQKEAMERLLERARSA